MKLANPASNASTIRMADGRCKGKVSILQLENRVGTLNRSVKTGFSVKFPTIGTTGPEAGRSTVATVAQNNYIPEKHARRASPFCTDFSFWSFSCH
jgi:hypothetical protein